MGSSIRIWIKDAAEQLADAGVTSALLDAELILSHTLRRSRTWLHAHDDTSLTAREREIADARLALRIDRTPLAYIIGHKEFYGRMFKVTPAVLVPRPESEACIELLRELMPATADRLIDIGTGSGCLGITAKCEFPSLDVTLSDISRHALAVARENATLQRANVHIIQSDLLAELPGTYDIVIANLPYVDRDWERSPETDKEPDLALFAERYGLALIDRLISELPGKVSPGGLVLLEADPEQHTHLIARATRYSLHHLKTTGYIVALQRD